MRFLRTPLQIIRADIRPYLAINVIAYGAFVVGFIAAVIFPELGADRGATLENNGTGDLVRSLFLNPALFAVVIFGVNVVATAAPWIVLPSLIVPFAGIAAFAYHAFTLGSGLAPTTDIATVGLIPHSLTVIIEFQAYALVMFGAYLLGRSWIRPASVGARTHRIGYLRGLKKLGWLSLPALALFVIGAIYEALSLRFLVQPLVELIL
ncbi:hypothetical protein B7R21_16895 [Subtercola boreus]|uniref:Stage II sporulation protein M n=1 Tax=Subtercola boreus TaxID=120213 RepID=A0A3E0VC68_9MICO|nr:stage II sporulation protein M [Subtercola boreus]RFA07133.1 hypothetical protein B7R21_16895 [Subtercola boreus]